jgi:DNA-binding CsgD family transcriptional regulator
LDSHGVKRCLRRVDATFIKGRSMRPRDGKDETCLTQRQLLIVALTGRGMTAVQIAAVLGISVNTVNSHRRTALARIGAATLSSAVAHCLRRGFIVHGPNGLAVAPPIVWQNNQDMADAPSQVDARSPISTNIRTARSEKGR